MFALRSSIHRTTLLTGRRMASIHALPRKPIPDCYQKSTFQKDFLSDPSTYPIILILGMASFWVVGMSANALVSYNDLRITPSHKHQTLRDWGAGAESGAVTKRLASGPIVMHDKEYRSIWQEGLGVDHEEWKKTKRARVDSE